jgi:hypothetical protein
MTTATKASILALTTVYANNFLQDYLPCEAEYHDFDVTEDQAWWDDEGCDNFYDGCNFCSVVDDHD